MQTSTLAVSKMDFFMILQLKNSIRWLESQKAPSYTPSSDEAFSDNKNDRCFTGSWIHLAKLYWFKQLPVTKIN